MRLVKFVQSILNLETWRFYRIKETTFERLKSRKTKQTCRFRQLVFFFSSRLIDGENVSCDEKHMWLCPFSPKDRIRITISLTVTKKLHGLRIWNYNKSPEDTYRGVSEETLNRPWSFSFFSLQVKRLHIQLNDKLVSPKQGFLLRRAPGHCFFDFGQEIVFAHGQIVPSSITK